MLERTILLDRLCCWPCSSRAISRSAGQNLVSDGPCSRAIFVQGYAALIDYLDYIPNAISLSVSHCEMVSQVVHIIFLIRISLTGIYYFISIRRIALFTKHAAPSYSVSSGCCEILILGQIAFYFQKKDLISVFNL